MSDKEFVRIASCLIMFAAFVFVAIEALLRCLGILTI